MNDDSSKEKDQNVLCEKLIHATDYVSSLFIVNDNDFCISFRFCDSSSRKYRVHVAIEDPICLGTTDCKALIDALLISSPGSAISPLTFRTLSMALQKKYHQVILPYFYGVEYILAMMPGISFERPPRNRFLITGILLKVENDNQISLTALTEIKMLYNLVLTCSTSDYGLCSRACRFIVAALRFLCPGNTVSIQQFLAETMVFCQICHFLGFEKQPITTAPGLFMFCSRFSASQLHLSDANFQEHPDLPNDIRNAINQVYPGNNEYASVHALPSQVQLAKSPFPCTIIQKTLYSDEMGTVHEGYYCGRPIMLRIIHGTTDNSLFASCVKHFLLLAPFKHIINVLDFYSTPEKGLIFENIDGEHGQKFVRSNFPFTESAVLSIAIDIARGILFIHEMGLVHNRLGLFNIIFRNGKALIRGLEFCFPNPELPRSWLSSHMLIQKKHDTILRSQSAILPLLSDNDHENNRTDNRSGQSSAHCLDSFIENSTPIYCDRIDVACFGVIIWELISGKVLLDIGGDKLTEQKLADLCFSKKQDLLQATSYYEDLQNIISQCWNENPNHRPTIRSVLSMLLDMEQKSTTASGMMTSKKEMSIVYNSSPIPRLLKNAERVFSKQLALQMLEEQLNQMHSAVLFEKRKTSYLNIHGETFDPMTSFEKRYGTVANRKVTYHQHKLTRLRKINSIMNTADALSNEASISLKTAVYTFAKPCINEMRRLEAYVMLGDEIMNEIEKGFSEPADCFDVDDIFDALTSPYQGPKSKHVSVLSSSHLLLVLSYRHVHPELRMNYGWAHRQRLSEQSYREISKRISRHACSIGAKTVSIWTDQHFSSLKSQDKWSNLCLFPYVIYPVLYFEDGENNHYRLWICAEHQLALSGAGIISEVYELKGIWRKTKNGFSGKHLSVRSALSNAASCLFPTIHEKETYHVSDRDEIVKWIKSLIFFSYGKGLWNISGLEINHADSEIAAAIVKHSNHGTWIEQCNRPIFYDGIVLRTSDGYISTVNDTEMLRSRGLKPWHGLFGWIPPLREIFNDGCQMDGTLIVESYTRGTIVEGESRGDKVVYAFLFQINHCGEICRSAIMELEELQCSPRTKVQNISVLSEFQFTIYSSQLTAINCMKKDKHLNFAPHLTVEDNMKRANIVMNGNYPSARFTTPPLSAVNEVLHEVEYRTIENMTDFKFVNGDEINWD